MEYSNFDHTDKLHYNDGWPWWMRAVGHMRRRIISTLQGSAIILTYHQVTRTIDDPHGLAIEPCLFAKHIALFTQNFSVVPLEDVVARLCANQALPPRALCLTFDDGYQDNFTHALPILDTFGAPATFFINGTSFENKASLHPWEQHAPERYLHADAELIARVSTNPLVTIGGHTKTHPRLADLSPEEQLSEIADNKKHLESLTGQKLKLFAYPFGGPHDFNETSMNTVQFCGYDAAMSTCSGLVTRKSLRYQLPREDLSHLSAERATEYLTYAFGG